VKRHVLVAACALALLGAGLLVTRPAWAGGTPSRKTGGNAALDGAVLESLAELLQGIRTLDGARPQLAHGDDFVESVRTRYGIPERIPVISPRGGTDYIIFAYNSEGLPVSLEGSYKILGPEDFKYLQSLHNLKAVYCLHEKEPVDVESLVLAFAPAGEKTTAFYNDPKGNLGSLDLREGHSVCFGASRYIIKPCRWAGGAK
jgi:hypothetical protein